MPTYHSIGAMLRAEKQIRDRMNLNPKYVPPRSQKVKNKQAKKRRKK